MIARVEIAIEDAIARYRRIEYSRNFQDLGLERLFLDESELDYAQSLRDHDRNQYIELVHKWTLLVHLKIPRLLSLVKNNLYNISYII